jgi:hypothetical protein
MKTRRNKKGKCMNTKKILIMFSVLASMLFSANITFTRSGWSVAGPILATGAIVGTAAAASSAAARDRDYVRYREEQAIRRERAAERRHRERMAAINAQNQEYVRPAVEPMDVYYDNQ